MTDNVYFISGIDTEIGKTYATGYLAQQYAAQGQQVITQKLIQTGNEAVSEDIQMHRKIMGIDFLAEDHAGLTMPEIFSYPASPHLAAEIDQREIDFAKIQAATHTLSERFDVVLLEGAGGLMVPLTRHYLTIDYIQAQKLPVILVTSGRLGSINHTLLSLQALKAHQVVLHAIAYNLNDDAKDHLIAKDTKAYLYDYMIKNFPKALWIDIPQQ
ncbi:dethiobiotin synthase [Acinetobacter apis]|uniref:ATP-dependent dethiobiotin synthetase BioD n=1 Tax=Acinetobacter apis TaxID=1229165 RepID=A0A217EFS7_9GAMM|nr:dethiobiotin synthase [Acinetobacter apis]SNQ29172.1 dethiobiotin synthetase [Acinetobacter apis]